MTMRFLRNITCKYFILKHSQEILTSYQKKKKEKA